LFPVIAIARDFFPQVHSDDVEIIEFSYVIYDAKETHLELERFLHGLLEFWRLCLRIGYPLVK
jgi:hypothetical protein